MDVLFQHIGQSQGSARASYGAQALIAELMPTKQADWLKEVLFLQAYSEQPTATFENGRRRGAADANAYLAKEQQYSFARFLFKDFRKLCRCTNPQLIQQLSTPRN
jgi:hypothetical protein